MYWVACHAPDGSSQFVNLAQSISAVESVLRMPSGGEQRVTLLLYGSYQFGEDGRPVYANVACLETFEELRQISPIQFGEGTPKPHVTGLRDLTRMRGANGGQV